MMKMAVIWGMMCVVWYNCINVSDKITVTNTTVDK